jgi:hypothetical protein
MGKREAKSSRDKVTISLDHNLYKNFQKYCEERAMLVSRKIDLLIKKELENEVKA